MTTTTPDTRDTTTPLGRTIGLTRANVRLMVRNRLTLTYALIFPLLPLVFSLFGDSDLDDQGWLYVLNTALLFALLFAVFYNLLSIVVTRRDELVLKRLRTGESRDAELITAMALPGAVITVIVTVLLGVIGAPLGLPLPANPVLVLIAVLAAVVTFAALAVWTASWTANAEAAQLSSLPVFALAALGPLATLLPERLATYAELTPGAAVQQLMATGWLGLDASGTDPVTFAAGWGEAVTPVVVLVAWSVLAGVLAHRSMRWEPRA